MNKKGMSFYAITALILFIVGAILVLANFNEIRTIYESFTEKTPCEFAVLASHISTKIPLISLQETLKKTCQPGKIIFEKESTNEVNEKMAKALYDCIRLMGEGKINLAKSLVIGKTVCFKCAEISFMDKAREKYNKMKITEGTFYEQLEKMNLKKDQTFAQYFNQFEEGPGRETPNLGLLYPKDIDSNTGYTIYMTKQEKPSSGLLNDIPLISSARKGFYKYSGGSALWNLLGYETVEQLSEKQLEDLLKARIIFIDSNIALSECKEGKGVLLNE